MDHLVKLLVLNGTHTAIGASMALAQLTSHNLAVAPVEIGAFARGFFRRCILPTVVAQTGHHKSDIKAYFVEWVGRLSNPHFGMHPLFICRNPISKLANRLVPLANECVLRNARARRLLAFAMAAMLRFITPRELSDKSADAEGEAVLQV
jgi:mannitol-1-phosphate/altronate dehydrogenase